MKTNTPFLNVSPKLSLRLAPGLLVAALIACGPLQTRANTALSFSGGTFEISTQDVTVGWALTLTGSVLVTDLGLWDGPTGFFGSTGDGFRDSHLVTIWTSTGIPVAQGTVPSGSGPESDNFRYVSIAPVILAAGNYTIGAFFPNAGGTGGDSFIYDASTITTASGVTYNGSRSAFGNGFPSGNSYFALANGDFGPNFQFTAAPTNGVPDLGSTWTLLLLGLTATCGLRFLRHQPV